MDNNVCLTHPDGTVEVLYAPTAALSQYHASTSPNLLMEGSRGTGKSTAMRWDFHLRAMAYPGYTYLILRRTMPELKKSHLQFIDVEMHKLGGFYHKTDNIAMYPNGSRGYYSPCETEADVTRYLSAQFAGVGFDEITTFDWDLAMKLATCARVTKDSGLTAIVRAGTNPLGISAEEVHRYFIAKDLTPEEDPEYNPDDWQSIHLVMDDNPHLDKAQYIKRFAGLPEAYRQAWLDGTWAVEGAYFSIRPEHVLAEMPTIQGPEGSMPALQVPWLAIYRVLDWGWHDQAVCAWIAVLPNGDEIPFKERTWTLTTAKEVAADIVGASEGMHVVTTFADPTLWTGEKEMGHCMAFEFEDHGVPLTRSKNDRTAAGQAIQEHLNTRVRHATRLDNPDLDYTNTHPKMRFYEPGTPQLLRAMRAMRVDTKHKGRIADHKHDHLPIALGYFCMAGVPPCHVPRDTPKYPWMLPKQGNRRILGNDNVRGRA